MNTKLFDYTYLLDHILEQQTDGSLSNAYRFERWQATRSLPWLLSALITTHADDAHAAEIASVAASIAPASPAYDTALYHVVAC